MEAFINNHPAAGSGRVFKFEDLTSTDLIVDAIYEGGRKGTSGDEPINKLVRGGNQGGFRYVGSPAKESTKLVILYSSMTDMDWPAIPLLKNSKISYTAWEFGSREPFYYYAER